MLHVFFAHVWHSFRAFRATPRMETRAGLITLHLKMASATSRINVSQAIGLGCTRLTAMGHLVRESHIKNRWIRRGVGSRTEAKPCVIDGYPSQGCIDLNLPLGLKVLDFWKRIHFHTRFDDDWQPVRRQPSSSWRSSWYLSNPERGCRQLAVNEDLVNGSFVRFATCFCEIVSM